MDQQKKIKGKAIRTALTLAIAMAFGAAVGFAPGMVQKAHASNYGETWSADRMTIEENRTIDGGVYVESDVVLTINDGVTLTVNDGMKIGDDAALTVKGKGTFVVLGANGVDGEDGTWTDGESGQDTVNGNIIIDGATVKINGGNGGKGGDFKGNWAGNGGTGGRGIVGKLTVNSGNVVVTGGNGGKGGNNGFQIGDPGEGGAGEKAVQGDVVVNGGSVTLNGGSGGKGGTSRYDYKKAKDGEKAKAVEGTITTADSLVVEDSEDGSKWYPLIDDASAKQYVKLYQIPVTVLVDVGKGHESLFTEEVLNSLKKDMNLKSATIEDSTLVLDGVYQGYSEYEASLIIDGSIRESLSSNNYIHNSEQFMDVAYKPIDDYATRDEADDDIGDERHRDTTVSDGLTYHLLWAKAIEKLELDNGDPTCGKEIWDALPTIPDGFMLGPDDTTWVDENIERVDKFTGGKEYTFVGMIYVNPYGPLWKNYIDPNNFALTVKDSNDLKYETEDNEIYFTFRITADHEWDAGTVTKQATENAEGERTFKCKHFDTCKGIKTEAIPKIKPAPKPTPAKVKSTARTVLVANGVALGKRGVNFAWNNVKADRYAIYLAQCNYKGKAQSMKRVKIVNGKTFKWKKSGLKKNTAYKFYVVAQKKSGKTYKNVAKSNVGHFFTGNVRGKLTNPKSLKLSRSALVIKKGRSATIKGSVAKVKKNKALATSHAPMLRYMSNDPTVAAVNASGKVTAKKAGTAVIYVQTINGIWKTCKVTVK